MIGEVVNILDGLPIEKPRVSITKARVELNNDNVYETLQISASKTISCLAGRFPLPNISEIVIHLLENTTPPIRISKKTIVEIFCQTKKKKDAIENPNEFASIVAKLIRERLADHLVDGIQYEKLNDWYEMSRLESSFETWEDYVIPAEHSVYDKIQFDSDLEKDFVIGLEKHPQVKMYLKLPNWFLVSTPVGNYNPDWAIVWQESDLYGDTTGKQLLYLVRETKGTMEKDKLLYPNEKRKIICGERHFKGALATDYKVVTSVKDLP